jgi:hypothetical protein
MIIRQSRTTMPKDAMSSAFTIAQTLERREKARVGSVGNARRSLANKLRIGVGTFENLVRERVKSVDAAIRDRLHALLIRELESEIERLTHELAKARQTGSHLASVEVGEIEAHLAKAHALLNGGA